MKSTRRRQLQQTALLVTAGMGAQVKCDVMTGHIDKLPDISVKVV